MTNFDYLKSEPQFSTFAAVAISAEKIIHIDPEASIINCRRSMEFAIKWMYSADNQKYKVIVSDRAKRMLGTHFRFLRNCIFRPTSITRCLLKNGI